MGLEELREQFPRCASGRRVTWIGGPRWLLVGAAATFVLFGIGLAIDAGLATAADIQAEGGAAWHAGGVQVGVVLVLVAAVGTGIAAAYGALCTGTPALIFSLAALAASLVA